MNISCLFQPFKFTQNYYLTNITCATSQYAIVLPTTTMQCNVDKAFGLTRSAKEHGILISTHSSFTIVNYLFTYMLLYFFFAFLKYEKEGTCLSAMQTAMQTATYYFSSSMPPVLILKALEN